MVQIHLLAPLRGREEAHLATLIRWRSPVRIRPTATIPREIKPFIKTHTAIFSFKKIFSSLVEHLSVKQNVVGSIPTIFSFCVLYLLPGPVAQQVVAVD